MYQKKWVIFLFKTYPIKFDFLIFVIFHIENSYDFSVTLSPQFTCHDFTHQLYIKTIILKMTSHFLAFNP